MRGKFGYDKDVTHWVRVYIGKMEVTLTEMFDTGQDSRHLITVARKQWDVVVPTVTRDFNLRLYNRKMKTGSWIGGDNWLDRLLGKELTLLLASIRYANYDDMLGIANNWSHFAPEERWWLANLMGNPVWRTALCIALAGRHLRPEDVDRYNFMQQFPEPQPSCSERTRHASIQDRTKVSTGTRIHHARRTRSTA